MKFWRKHAASTAGLSANTEAPIPAIVQTSTSFEDLRDAAGVHASRSNYAEAVEIYTAALAKRPEDMTCLLSRSIANMSLVTPNLHASIQDAESAINAEPGSWQAWNQSGNALLASERYAEAEQAFRQAVRLAQPTERMGPEQMLVHVRRLRASAAPTHPPRLNIAEMESPQSAGARPTTPLPPSPSLAAARPAAPVDGTAISRQESLSPPTLPQTTPSLLQPRSTTPNPIPATPVALSVGSPPASSAPLRSQTTSAAALAELETPFDPLVSPPSSQDPPPQYSRYTASQGSRTQATAALTLSTINGQATAIRQLLIDKKKGMIQLAPYVLPGQIDSVRLQHIGYTSIESAVWDLCLNSFSKIPHASLSHCYIDTGQLPGNTFLDSDPESSIMYDGFHPGTTSVFGANEEYRAAQLYDNPPLSLTFESNLVPPVMSMKDIVARITLLQANPALEDNEGLRKTLGIASWESPLLLSSGRLRQIDAICMSLNRGQFSAPERFFAFKNAVNFSSHFLGTADRLQNFLFQVLLGAELLIRVRKEPITTSYKGWITDNISSVMLMAKNWMENVNISETTVLTAGTPKYLLGARAQAQHVEALISFAEKMCWPYLEETRHFMQTAYLKLQQQPATINNIIRDWLYGMHQTGKIFRHQLLSVLVESSASARTIGQAVLWMDGLIVGSTSYWPSRSVIGRVLGALPGIQTICGVVGPVAIPVTGAASPCWVYAQANAVPIPVPLISQVESTMTMIGLSSLNGLSAEEDEAVRDLRNVDRWKPPVTLTPQPPSSQSSAELKCISLIDASPSGTPSKTQYRVRLDFALSHSLNAAIKQTSYILYSNPLFVAAPQCVGANHPIFELKTKKHMNRVFRVYDLITSNPSKDDLMIIDARGKGEETVARAWCAERGRNAVVRRSGRGCFACAAKLASRGEGLGFEVLIWAD